MRQQHPHRRFRRIYMQPLRFSINVTLDGCFDHTAAIPDEDLHRNAAQNIDRSDALLLGRVIYGMMEEAWREPAETGVCPDWMAPWMLHFAHTIHKAKKYVVSTTLDRVDWNAELIRENLEETILQLKQEPGNGIFVGGEKLARSLTELGLIDEYEFIVHPRVIGRGPALFTGLSKPLDLKLVDQIPLRSGAVAMRYALKR